jgi:proteasome lid subunit RPN8/RPN11
MRQLLSGSDVIVWKEQPPDFYRRPVADLVPNLPFVTACVVMLPNGGPPLVVAPLRVMDQIWDHLSEKWVEMGGLIIGRVYDVTNSDSGFIVSIEDHVRCEEFEGTGASLRMDTGVWEAARAKSGVDRSVIGWYHSHPGLGAFFSGTDRRTQSNFFNQPHCLGVVVDPFRHEEKWFIGDRSEELEPFQILRFKE